MGELIIKSKHGNEVMRFDDADADIIQEYSWSLHNSGGASYARTSRTISKGKREWFFAHNLITSTIYSDLSIDHKNGDGLDNRRINLRICTHSQNAKNRKTQANNKSGYKGVVKIKNTTNRSYRAFIRCDGKQIDLGCFSTPEEAASAYDVKAKALFGEFARLNSTAQGSAVI